MTLLRIRPGRRDPLLLGAILIGLLLAVGTAAASRLEVVAPAAPRVDRVLCPLPGAGPATELPCA